MALANEIEQVLPLDGAEIKEGIAHKVAVAVMEALSGYGPLYGRAYDRFECTLTGKIRLNDFGLIREGNINATVAEGEVDEDAIEVPVEIDIPETPPNVFRKETEQSIPTIVQQGSTTREQRISYASRKGKLGRSR